MIGLLDRIIGYDYWMVFLHPTMGDVVADASQGRFFLFFLRHFLKKGHIWSKKLISGPDFLKNVDIYRLTPLPPTL